MRQLRRSSRTKTFAIKFSPHTSPTKVKRSISLNSKAITTFTIPLKQKVKKEKIEENDTLQAKDQPESIEQKEANHGRISVAIRNLAPSSTSIIQLSEAFRVAGLNWRLQILFNRNTFTGQSRFISVYVICEDLPFNESLVTLITFRLVSQEEGYAGMDKEIIAHFNGSTRSVGISNFVLFKNIFAEDSEYLNKDFNEAQIVAIIRVKSRQKTILSINQKIKYLCQFPQTSTTQIFKNFELNKEDKNKKRRNKLFNLQINDKIVKEEQNEIKENILENNRRDNTLESIENKNPDDSACSLNDSTNNSRRRDISFTKNKITDFFPSRRSSRITPSFLDILRLQVLKEQVNLAVNEPYLEIFTSEIKGRGLRTQLSFAKDEFVVEYKGEIINMKRAKRRELIYSNDPKIGCYMFYFTHNEKKLCIDATKETGDKGRLVNHSRLVPNLKAKVLDFGEKYPHLCLVALREIQIGEELLFDYGDRTALTVEKHPWLLNT